ncbi:MAG TPA: hypothetical protein VHB21_20475 [Minicystis sp.]|nr:hypothetical protein [Minicystis sp.]
MASKLVTDYARSAQAIIDALRAQAKPCAAVVEASLAAMCGPGEKVPDVAMLLELLARRLEHDRAELERADQQKGVEAADTHDPRTARDAAAHELYATLLEVKRTVGALFGAAWIKKLQFPADFRADSVPALVRTGKDVAKALKDRALPEPSIEGVKAIDPKPWQKRLRQAVKDLEAANASLGVEQAELDTANVGKANAVAAFERTFAGAATLAGGVLQLGGKDEEADALPRSPRKVRRAKNAAGGGGATDSGPTPPAPSNGQATP